MASLKYWLWLTTRRGVAGSGALSVLEHFGSPEHAFFADPEEYKLLPEAVRRGLLDKSMEKPEEIMAECDRLGVGIMTINDSDYPRRLYQLHDAPAVLYVRGKLPDLDEEAAVAVVGTRRTSEYGIQTAGRLGMELARGGAVVVSGIAQGIDSCALKGALQGGGRVVSVLGGGVDVVYPRENRYLYEDVAAAGALVSEYPPGTKHKGEHFPVRNRIISGLSLGVVVVEAGLSSGALLTAQHAVDQDRDVFAVPGNIDGELSRGCNRLIQQGAKLVTSAEDILVEYRGQYPAKLGRVAPLSQRTVQQRLETVKTSRPPQKRKTAVDNGDNKEYSSVKRSPEGFSDDELSILRALEERPRQADELVELTQIPIRRVLSALTMLQLGECVEERPGEGFCALVSICYE